MVLKNIDENGVEIKDVDWSMYERERVEEEYDADGNLTGLISHCRKIPESIINQKSIEEAKQGLNSTDYVAAKTLDALLSCSNITDILEVLTKFKMDYGDVIEQRKEWRNKINELESKGL